MEMTRNLFNACVTKRKMGRRDQPARRMQAKSFYKESVSAERNPEHVILVIPALNPRHTNINHVWIGCAGENGKGR